MQGKLIIHCGVQKTGSTSLHHFLQKNRDRLAAVADIHVPTKGSAMRALGRAAMQFSLNPKKEPQLVDAIADMRAQMKAGTTVLSHENLPGAMMGKGGVVTLYPQIERIISLLDQGFAPLRPHYVIYTRDMAGWKTSVYNQAVRSDHYTHSRARFLQDTDHCGDWQSLQARMVWAAGADRVSVFRLEDEPDLTRPGRQLLHLLGLDTAGWRALAPLAGRSNPSLNAGALEFLRLINGLGLNKPDRTRVADLVADNQSLFVSG